MGNIFLAIGANVPAVLAFKFSRWIDIKFNANNFRILNFVGDVATIVSPLAHELFAVSTPNYDVLSDHRVVPLSKK